MQALPFLDNQRNRKTQPPARPGERRRQRRALQRAGRRRAHLTPHPLSIAATVDRELDAMVVAGGSRLVAARAGRYAVSSS